MAKAKTAVAKKEETGVEAYNYDQSAGKGFEGQTEDDYQIPFLLVLQKSSPQCDKDEAAYMKDAKPGMFFNNVSQELFDEVTFVGAITEHIFTQWKPDRGGFVGKHVKKGAVVQRALKECEFAKYKTEDGDDLTETFNIFAIQYKGDEVLGGVVISLTSTKIKPYKGWTSKIRSFQLKGDDGVKMTPPPLFAHRVKMTTVLEKRPAGASYNVVLRPENANLRDSLLPVGDPRFDAAFEFGKLIKSGDAKVDYDKAKKGEGDGDDSFDPKNF